MTNKIDPNFSIRVDKDITLHIPTIGSTSMGYWLDENHQGNGTMTKSVKALMDYGFNVLKLHRIQILCAVHNIKSQKIALSLDFKKEGTLKDAIHHYDSFFDAYLYALIAPNRSSRT